MTTHFVDITDTSNPISPDYQKTITNADRISIQPIEYDSTRMNNWCVVSLNRFKHMQQWTVALGDDNMIQIHNSDTNICVRIVMGKEMIE